MAVPKFGLLLLLPTLAVQALSFWQPASAQMGGTTSDAAVTPLTTLNDEFRKVYGATKADLIAENKTLIICYSDHMVLIDGENRDEIAFLPASYTQLKTVDHIPLALFVYLNSRKDRQLDRESLEQLAKIKALTIKARPAYADLGLDSQTLSRQYRLIDQSVVFIDRVSAAKQVSSRELISFCRRMKPDIMLNAAQAVGVQLAVMDKKVCEWKQRLGAERFKNINVAIVSGHMPREQHSCYQYFARVFHTRREGLQIVYSEGATEEKPTRELIGTHNLDASIGEAFFKEKLRMHRDLLADGARQYLQKHPPKAKI